MAVDSLAKKITLLRDQGYLAESRLSAGDRTRLQGLFDAGVLHTVRGGAGRRIVVHDANALEAFIGRIYPSGLEGTQAKLPSRSKAVAELRNAKKARGRQPVAVLLRGFHASTLHSGNHVLPIAGLTETAGLAALRLDEESSWGFSGTVAVVENLEVFWNFEKLQIAADIAMWTQGRLHRTILAWLASPAMHRARIIHCGDYDPVGLDEFLRLKAACPKRTKLYIPPDFEHLLSRYGKKELITDNAAILARLRKNHDPQVGFIVALMDRFGVGLEQEVLLLNTP